MTRHIVAALAACSLLLVGTASAQDISPTVVITAPALGVDLATLTGEGDAEIFSKGRLTVMGTATDDTRVTQVRYRIEGKKRWRRATLIGSGGSYNWSFRMTVNRRSAKRFYVRAIDNTKNESDTIGRRVRRNRR